LSQGLIFADTNVRILTDTTARLPRQPHDLGLFGADILRALRLAGTATRGSLAARTRDSDDVWARQAASVSPAAF
jgi:hypothetical protein